jgi:hypothetical protein
MIVSKLVALCVFSLLGLFIVSHSAISFAAYDPLGDACANAPSSTACLERANNGDRIAGNKGIIQTVTNIVGALAGIAAVVMIVVAGIMLSTAGGDQGKITRARSMILGAVIGVVIVVLAWGITTFIISRFTT